MCMCRGERVCAGVKVAARGFCRGSVDRSSWKQTGVARNSGMARNNKFLKMSCDWNGPMAAEGFLVESRGFFLSLSLSLFFFFEEAKLLTAVGRAWTERRLLKSSVVPVILGFKPVYLFPPNISLVHRRRHDIKQIPFIGPHSQY